jgi:hypothetical protein
MFELLRGLVVWLCERFEPRKEEPTHVRIGHRPVVELSDEAKRMVAEGMAAKPPPKEPPPPKPLAGSVRARIELARKAKR